MATIDKFLEDLLSSQDLLPVQVNSLQAHKMEVAGYLQKEFGDDPVIKYAGSYEKGTMIRDNYDLDIVCYFPSSDQRSLKEIRQDVTNHLAKNYQITAKASAERIINLNGVLAPASYHIDVVPGRFIENTKDVFIYLAHGDKDRLQTNLKTHINYIVGSGCVPVIRLAKIWCHRNALEIKTFVLEMFVVETLKGANNKNNLSESFLRVLEAMKDDFKSKQLIDPANSNNIVSQQVDPVQKAQVAFKAELAFNQLNASNDVDVWQKAFNENPKQTLVSSATINSSGLTPRAPWSCC